VVRGDLTFELLAYDQRIAPGLLQRLQSPWDLLFVSDFCTKTILQGDVLPFLLFPPHLNSLFNAESLLGRNIREETDSAIKE